VLLGVAVHVDDGVMLGVNVGVKVGVTVGVVVAVGVMVGVRVGVGVGGLMIGCHVDSVARATAARMITITTAATA